MSRQHHQIKISPKWFILAEKGEKRFEIRENDRNYQVGDMVTMKEFADGEYTGREFGPLEIDYVFEGLEYGLRERICIFTYTLSFTPVPEGWKMFAR